MTQDQKSWFLLEEPRQDEIQEQEQVHGEGLLSLGLQSVANDSFRMLLEPRGRLGDWGHLLVDPTL